MSNASASTVNQFSSISGQVSPGKPVVSLSATTTLTAAQSGTLFFIPNGAGRTITLPNPSNSPGVQFEFVVSGVTAGGVVDITSPTAGSIYGTMITYPEVGANLAISAGTTFTTARITAAATRGTWVKLVSDGTNWFASGQGGSAAACLAQA